jgi:hypothetical protein
VVLGKNFFFFFFEDAEKDDGGCLICGDDGERLLRLKVRKRCHRIKLLGNDEFNHLTNILTLPLMCGLRLVNDWGPTHGIFNFLNGR